jgi:hypothetical protein
MHVSRYSEPFSAQNLTSAIEDTSTERFSRKSPRPTSGSSTRAKFSRVSACLTKRTPYSWATLAPASSAVTIVIWSGLMPTWRRISGRTPWPMLPKPTNTRRPGKTT